MRIKLIIAVVLLLLVITFMVQNAALVEVKLILWHIEIPRSLLIFMTLLIGMLIGWFSRAILRRSRPPAA